MKTFDSLPHGVIPMLWHSGKDDKILRLQNYVYISISERLSVSIVVVVGIPISTTPDSSKAHADG